VSRDNWIRRFVIERKGSAAIKEYQDIYYGYFSRFQECDPIYDNDPQRRTHVVLVPSSEEWRQLQGADKCTRRCGYPNWWE